MNDLNTVNPTVLSKLECALDALTTTARQARKEFFPEFASPTLESLALMPIFVAWRSDRLRNGRLAKVPYNPRTRGRAKTDKKSTWGSLRDAKAASESLLRRGQQGGVGVVLGWTEHRPDFHLLGLDLDSCLDPAGRPFDWAEEIIKRFDSYTEISPGGEGVKVFFRVAAGNMDRVRELMGRTSESSLRQRISWTRGPHQEIAIDAGARYYTITWNLLPGCRKGLRKVSVDDVRWLIQIAGPAYASEDSKLARDESNSGYGFRFLLACARRGYSKEQSLELLSSDSGKAGGWASYAGMRQLNRAWTHAVAKLEEDDASAFDSWSDDWLEQLNSRHAVIQHGGKTFIAHERDDKKVEFGDVRHFHTLYENVRVSGERGKLIAASKLWMSHPDRRTFPDGIVFDPSNRAPETCYNLWKGFAVTPDPDGSCDLFLQHLENVVCDGDAELMKYLIGWLAHLIQKPEEKPGVALVVRGAKGAGKDTIGEYLSRIVGAQYCPTIAHSEHLTGRFNSRLQNALLLRVQEGLWAGDRKAESQLKYLVTSETIEIERKGLESFQMSSMLRILITANAMWVVPASTDERRWAVFSASNARCGDRSYFEALFAEMDDRGPGALLAYLLNYDLSDFDVRKAPKSQALTAQKLESLRNFDRWWFETLDNGSICGEGDSWTKSGFELECSAVYDLYDAWHGQQKYHGPKLDNAQFGRSLKQVCPEVSSFRPRRSSDPSRPRHYRFPDLPTCRTRFEEILCGEVDWHEDL